MKKKILGECDEYTFRIPLAKLFSGRKQFIYSELEKRHPCFSENFEIDVKNRIRKKGVYASVAVIDKEDLLKFKRNKEALLCNKNGKVLFKDKNYFLMILCFFVFSVLFLLYFKYSRRKNEIKEPEIQASVLHEEPLFIRDFCFTKILNKAVITSGKISRLSWKYENNTEVFNGSFRGIHPLDLNVVSTSGFIISPVTYENGVPAFNANYRKQISGGLSVSEVKDLDILYRQVLEKIRSKGGEILADELNNQRTGLDLKFNLKNLETLGRITEELSEEFNVSGFEISSGVEAYSISLQLLFAEKNGFSLKELGSLVSETSRVFEKIKKTETKIEKEEKIESLEVFAKPEERKKIGEIIYADGTRSVYYKNEKGKLINEKK